MNSANPLGTSAKSTPATSRPPVGVDQQVAELLVQWQAQDSGFQPPIGVASNVPATALARKRSASRIAGLLRSLCFHRGRSSP